MSDIKEPTAEEIAASEQAEFKAAFSGESSPADGEVDKAEAEQDDAVQSEADAESESDATPDGDHDDPDEVVTLTRGQLAAMRGEIASEVEQRFSGRIRNIEGHLGGVKSKLQDLYTAREEARKQGSDTPTTQQITEAAASSEKLAALREDFPEFAEALEETVSMLRKDLQPRQPAMPEDRRTATVDDIERLNQLRILDRRFPSWEEDVGSDAYKNWLANQPEDIQSLTRSNSASDALKVLKSYSEFTAQQRPPAKKGRQTERLSAAEPPTNGNRARQIERTTEHDEFLKAFSGG